MATSVFSMILAVLACPLTSENCPKSRFQTLPGCSRDYRSDDIHARSETVSGIYQCAKQCLKDTSCLAVNICPLSAGLFHCDYLSVASASCTSLQFDSGYIYLEKTASYRNDGTGSDCSGIYSSGNYEEKILYRDCSEAFDAGLRASENTVLTIQPDNYPTPKNVTCHLDNGGWTVVQMREIQCPEAFNRTWAEFKAGWSSACNSWLGLEILHAITAQDNYVLDVTTKNSAGRLTKHLYHGIKIDSETNGYPLNYNWSEPNSSNPSEDGFEYGASSRNIRGEAFATWDHPDPSSCVVAAGAGWWYGVECPEVNLHRTIDLVNDQSRVARWPNEDNNLEPVQSVQLRLQKESTL